MMDFKKKAEEVWNTAFDMSVDSLDDPYNVISAALEQAYREGVEARLQNILKTESSEWIHTHEPQEVACHSRMIEGVLCRWWGLEEPPGVVRINSLLSKSEEVKK